jgi:hypothetical protein
MDKKILIASFFVTFIILVPTTSVIGISSNNRIESSKTDNDSLPDLIVIFTIHNDPWEYFHADLEIKNIGDAPLYERPDIWFMLIGLYGLLIPGIKYIKQFKDVYIGEDGCLMPGETELVHIFYSLWYGLGLGFFMILIKVNNKRSIIESNYDNNLEIQIHNNFLGL